MIVTCSVNLSAVLVILRTESAKPGDVLPVKKPTGWLSMKKVRASKSNSMIKRTNINESINAFPDSTPKPFKSWTRRREWLT